jgi:uncharacterized membrane protein YkoI
MNKHNQNKEQSTEVPKSETQREKTAMGGATKKCLHCGEELPEKIAFCLYCMKPTRERTEHNSQGESQGNKGNKSKKKSMILLIVAATFALVAVVAVTSIVTANFMLRRSAPNDRHLQTQATPTSPASDQQNPITPREDTLQAGSEDVYEHTTPYIPVVYEEEALTLSSEGMFNHITPRAPEQQGGPANPAISAIRAVELAHDHLLAMGITNARFDYVYMDREDGIWVWSVEFELGDSDFEFYVDVESGAFLKAPDGGGTNLHQGGGHQGGTTSNTNWRGPGRAPLNWPSSVAITPERAVEIALERVQGTVHEVDHDFERGIAAWYVEIRSGGRTHEIKVDVQTGDIIYQGSW